MNTKLYNSSMSVGPLTRIEKSQAESKPARRLRKIDIARCERMSEECRRQTVAPWNSHNCL